MTHPRYTPTHPPLLNLGFRPFFLLAGLSAMASILIWLGIYFSQSFNSFSVLSPFTWHAHQLIFGYGMAVIAGFLLTASKNWTQLQTPHGWPLLGLVCPWLIARLCWLTGDQLLFLAACFDLAFSLLLCVALANPIIKTRQWRQLAILSKLFLLSGCNLLFYLGAFEVLDVSPQTLVMAALYLVIGLILTVGRRVIPFFISRGIETETELYNARWLDISSMSVFILFFVFTTVIPHELSAQLSALLLFLITLLRLWGWHHKLIWRKPLLWSLYIALGFICAGFALHAGGLWFDYSPFLAVHAFGFGGMGTMTIAMMARVSIGHTGRSLHSPHKGLGYVFAAFVAGALTRTLLPLLAPDFYAYWLGLSGFLWLASFIGFLLVFFPILSQARIDLKYG